MRAKACRQKSGGRERLFFVDSQQSPTHPFAFQDLQLGEREEVFNEHSKEQGADKVNRFSWRGTS